MSRRDKPHQGAVVKMFAVFGSGSVGFVDWLDAALELLRRRLTLRDRGYCWRGSVALSGKVFLQLIRDSLFDHVLNGIGKRGDAVAPG